MDNETSDLWDHSTSYNLNSPPKEEKKKEPESSMAKAAKKNGTSVKTSVTKTSVTAKPVPEKKSGLSMVEKYSAAWLVIYSKKEKWRQKEISRTFKENGRLSDEGWDTDFVKEVIQLAEREGFGNG